MKRGIFIISGLLITMSINAQLSSLPLLKIKNLEYQGGFIIPSAKNDVSRADYSIGTIAYNNQNNSLFLAGHNIHGAIAEFEIPTLVNSSDISKLNTASVLQEFRSIMDKTPDGNPQNLNRISGMAVIKGKLVVNALEYYDAPADNTNTTLIIETPNALATSDISGYYSMEGAAHAAGWISPFPKEWQDSFDGDYLSGNSSRYPIASRNAMGISAFVLNSKDITNNTTNTIPTIPMLDFDLKNPLYAEYSSYKKAQYNLAEVNGTTSSGHTASDADITVGTNNLWTSASEASYGLIVPGTRTYLTLGASGGHNSGIGYKATQNNGNLCGGPCTYDADDNYNYYWLWDVIDLLAVKNGQLNPHDVRPYAYGVFEVPFQTDVYSNTPEFHPIKGGTFDPASGLLYLSIWDGGSTGNYQRTPAIAAYKFTINTSSVNATTTTVGPVIVYPNPASLEITVSVDKERLDDVIIYNELGQFIKSETSNRINISNLSQGLYFVCVYLKNNEVSINKLIVE